MQDTGMKRCRLVLSITATVLPEHFYLASA